MLALENNKYLPHHNDSSTNDKHHFQLIHKIIYDLNDNKFLMNNNNNNSNLN